MTQLSDFTVECDSYTEAFNTALVLQKSRSKREGLKDALPSTSIWYSRSFSYNYDSLDAPFQFDPATGQHYIAVKSEAHIKYKLFDDNSYYINLKSVHNDSYPLTLTGVRCNDIPIEIHNQTSISKHFKKGILKDSDGKKLPYTALSKQHKYLLIDGYLFQLYEPLIKITLDHKLDLKFTGSNQIIKAVPKESRKRKQYIQGLIKELKLEFLIAGSQTIYLDEILSIKNCKPVDIAERITAYLDIIEKDISLLDVLYYTAIDIVHVFLTKNINLVFILFSYIFPKLSIKASKDSDVHIYNLWRLQGQWEDFVNKSFIPAKCITISPYTKWEYDGYRKAITESQAQSNDAITFPGLNRITT